MKLVTSRTFLKIIQLLFGDLSPLQLEREAKSELLSQLRSLQVSMSGNITRKEQLLQEDWL